MKRTRYDLDWSIDDANDIVLVDPVGDRITPPNFVPLTESDLLDMLTELGYRSTRNVISGSNE